MRKLGLPTNWTGGRHSLGGIRILTLRGTELIENAHKMKRKARKPRGQLFYISSH